MLVWSLGTIARWTCGKLNSVCLWIFLEVWYLIALSVCQLAWYKLVCFALCSSDFMMIWWTLSAGSTLWCLLTSFLALPYHWLFHVPLIKIRVDNRCWHISLCCFFKLIICVAFYFSVLLVWFICAWQSPATWSRWQGWQGGWSRRAVGHIMLYCQHMDNIFKQTAAKKVPPRTTLGLLVLACTVMICKTSSHIFLKMNPLSPCISWYYFILAFPDSN